MEGDDAVATLWVGNHSNMVNACEIFPRLEFQIGRADVNQLLNVIDPIISHKHVSIRCVQFDKDVNWGVSPVIYIENLSRNGAYLKRIYLDHTGHQYSMSEVLDKAKGSVPFLDGDQLFLNPRAGIFVQLDIRNKSGPPLMPSLMEREIMRFEQDYAVTPQVIGVGGHGTVYIAIHQQSRSPIACKVVPLYGVEMLRERMNNTPSESSTLIGDDALTQITQTGRTRISTATLKSKIRRLQVEYDILKDLDHPNIIAVRQVFVTTHHIYIMQELITGGDLLSFMEVKGPRLSNAQSAVITLQLLKAVDYLHDRGIVHRDIKPDNILMTCWKAEARVILTDFGHSKRIARAHATNAPRRMFTTVGTAGYTAPEVHRNNEAISETSGYSSAVDMWSVGTITAILVTGNIIFAGNSDIARHGWDSRTAKIRAAARCDISIIDCNEGEWQNVSKKAREFVKALLVLDEKKRLTAKQALEHPWLYCPEYRDSLEEVYKHAISSWTPRPKTKNIVQRINTGDLEWSSSPQSSPGPVKSTYFNNTTLYASEPAHSSSDSKQDYAIKFAVSAQQGQKKRKAEYSPELDRPSNHGQRLPQLSLELGAPWSEQHMQESFDRSLGHFIAQGSPELGICPETQTASAPTY